MTNSCAPPKRTDISYSEFVARLLRAQWHDRQESALEWRIRRANLPERWSLETFPFARQPGVNRKQIRAFAELDFVAKAREHRVRRPHRRGQDRTGLRPAAEGAWRTATAASSSAPRTCSMRCTHRWPTAPRGSCSSAWRAWTSC